MRKNIIKIIGILILAAMLAACGGKIKQVSQFDENRIQEDTQNDNSDDNLEKSSDSAKELTIDEIEENTVSQAETDNIVDIDLTILSSTMVYSQVYNMLYDPQDYIGKTVKMQGMFVAYTNQDESQYYPAVIIADATACCSQGLEFILEGNPSFPEAYPEMETEITVIGTFETYEEEGTMYCRLQNARIE